MVDLEENNQEFLKLYHECLKTNDARRLRNSFEDGRAQHGILRLVGWPHLDPTSGLKPENVSC